MVGSKLSVPPSWAGTVASATSSAAAVETVGWTAAVPQAGAGAIVPGMPGMVRGARNSAGFGAPRYGVKPIVMPKPTAVLGSGANRSQHSQSTSRIRSKETGYRKMVLRFRSSAT